MRVREYFRDAWHEYPVLQDEPADVFLMPFGLIPLDFVGRVDAAGQAARESRRTVSRDVPLAPAAVRRHLEINAGAPDVVAPLSWDAGDGRAAPARLTYWITDSLAPGDSRSLTWDRDLPWWLERRSPAGPPALIAWYPRGLSHAK